MATITITKDLIGKEDLKIQNSTTTTYSRATSTGGSNTLTKLARSTLCTFEYDVVQFGAVGDGLTNDRAAIQAALNAAITTGGRIVFPAGYDFAVKPTGADAAIFELNAAEPLTISMYGATLTVLGDTDSPYTPSTAAFEKTTAAVFKATALTDLTFEGGTVELSRNWPTQDTKYAFFKGAYCNNVRFFNVQFKNCSNYYGVIYMTDSAGGQLARWNGLTVRDCEFSTSGIGVYVEGAMRNVVISGNKFRDMDIAPYQSDTDMFATDDNYGTSTYKQARAIKVKGFGNGAQGATDTINGGTLGNVEGIVISDNVIYGCGLGIDITSGSITDSSYFRDITVTGNTIWGQAGIAVRMASRAVISGNTFSRLNSTDLGTYDDTAYVNALTSGNYLTSAEQGFGVDVRKSQDVTVSSNVIDGGYQFSTQENDCFGIGFGENADDIIVNAIVADNTIRKCEYGIRAEQSFITSVRGNFVKNCKYAMASVYGSTRNTAVSVQDNECTDNTFIADVYEHALAGNSLLLVELAGKWDIRGNTFIGRTATGTDMRLLTLKGFDSDADAVADIGDIRVCGNTFRRFEFTPVEVVNGSGNDATMLERVTFMGNMFYSEQASLPASTVGCIKLNRPTNTQTLVVNGSGNFASNVPRAFILTYPAANGGTETYNFGQWEHDQNNDGASYDWRLFDDGGVTNTNATGYAGVFRSGRGIMTRRMQINCNSATGQVTISDALPPGIIWYVSARNDSLLVMGSSGAGYKVGYGASTTPTDDDYWGKATALTADAVSGVDTTSVATTPLLVGRSSTENDLMLTAILGDGSNGGTFTSGQVVVTVFYSPMTGDEF